MRVLAGIMVLLHSTTALAVTFEPAAVNTPRGVACPLLFTGKPGIAFKGEYAVQIARILENADACEKAQAALAARQEESAARKEAGAAKDRVIQSLQLSTKVLEAALDKEQERANTLQEALNSSKWRWFWSIVAGLAVGAGISYGMRTLLK